MTLTEALGIKERFLKFEDMRAMDYAEKRWKEAGEPTERWAIINFLERMLRELKERGGYPKVLLLRKKEIQRGTYAIPKAGEVQAAGDVLIYTAGSHPQIPAEWIRQAEQEFIRGKKRGAGA
jgi:hypothetical protein